MSFNLRASLGWDHGNPWLRRRKLVRKLLTQHQPQVVGFQELWATMESYVSGSLPVHRVVHGEGTGLCVLPVRNPIYYDNALRAKSSGSIWLGKKTWRVSRSATWMRADYESRELIVLNTHLDHVSESARVSSAKRIIEQLRTLGWPEVPAIVCGDFNANPGSTVHRIFLDAGLRDCFLDVNKVDDENSFTFHGFTGQRCGHDRRIDWIFCSPEFHCTRATIEREANSSRYASDHYAVVADLSWHHHQSCL